MDRGILPPSPHRAGDILHGGCGGEHLFPDAFDQPAISLGGAAGLHHRLSRLPRHQNHVTRSAASGIYRAIGREEAAIRANPQATNDPLLIGVFALSR